MSGSGDAAMYITRGRGEIVYSGGIGGEFFDFEWNSNGLGFERGSKETAGHGQGLPDAAGMGTPGCGWNGEFFCLLFTN